MKLSFLLVYILQFLIGFSQLNLVPNGNMEDYNSCPTFDGCIDSSSTIFPCVDKWFKAGFGSSDYFNTCASLESLVNVPETYLGINFPKSCDGMAGIILYYGGYDYREYIEIELSEHLLPSTEYYLEFWVKSAYKPNVVILDVIVVSDEIGAYFSEEELHSSEYYYIDVEPQVENIEGNYFTDSQIWNKVSGVYLAEGGEKFITIGNFKNDSETDYVLVDEGESTGRLLTSYLFIDDVSLNLFMGHFPSNDTLFKCEGEVIKLTAEFGNTYLWNTGETTQTIEIEEEGTYEVVIDFGCFIDTLNYYVFDQFTTVNTESIQLIICETELPYLLVSESGYENYVWSTNEIVPSINIDSAGIFSVVANTQCDFQIDSFFISVINPSDFLEILPNDTLICSEEFLPFEISIGGNNSSFLWSNGGTTSSFLVTQEENISVEVGNACGIFNDKMIIRLLNCSNIFIPSAFTPNGDGINDIFLPISNIPIDIIYFSIYNRWGQIIFNSTNIENGWNGDFNGKEAVNGSYTYVVEYIDLTRKKKIISGSVILIR